MNLQGRSASTQIDLGPLTLGLLLMGAVFESRSIRAFALDLLDLVRQEAKPRGADEDHPVQQVSAEATKSRTPTRRAGVFMMFSTLLLGALLHLLTIRGTAQKQPDAVPELPFRCEDVVALTPAQIPAVVLKANAGSVQAQCALGIAYHQGRLLEQDDSEAARWLSKAAGAGIGLAQVHLGYLYEKGSGVKQNDVEAVRWYEESAEQGVAAGQNNLGYMYREGRGGLPRSDEQAANWYRKAAAQGLSTAEYNLGMLYLNGKGVGKGYAVAFELLQAGATRGEPASESATGFMYFKGYGVKQDYTAGLRWTRSAAEKGDPQAQQNLGYIYENGLGISPDHHEAMKWYCFAATNGVPAAQNAVGYYLAMADLSFRDYANAARWYRRAADQGYVAAETNLGVLYATGRGVPLDYLEAFVWLSTAKAGGGKEATRALIDLRRIMTPKQITKAELRFSKMGSNLPKSYRSIRSTFSTENNCPLADITTASR